jgi:hypothetical protein
MLYGFGGIRFPHVKGFGSLTFKSCPLSSSIFSSNLGGESEGSSGKTSKMRPNRRDQGWND